MERRNTNYLIREGLDEDEKKWNVSGAEAPVVLPGGDGKNEEESARGQAEQGVAAAEREAAGELSGQGPFAAGAESLMDDGNQEDRGTSGGDLNELQPQEPLCEDMGLAENVQPVSVLVRQRCFHYKFSQWQLQELERFFQYNHYISAEVRKQLARWIGVTEARIQNWFKGRREQYRRDQKL